MHKKLLISLFFFTAAQQIFSAFPNPEKRILEAEKDLNAAYAKYGLARNRLNSLVDKENPEIQAVLSDLEENCAIIVSMLGRIIREGDVDLRSSVEQNDKKLEKKDYTIGSLKEQIKEQRRFYLGALIASSAVGAVVGYALVGRIRN